MPETRMARERDGVKSSKQTGARGHGAAVTWARQPPCPLSSRLAYVFRIPATAMTAIPLLAPMPALAQLHLLTLESPNAEAFGRFGFSMSSAGDDDSACLLIRQIGPYQAL